MMWVPLLACICALSPARADKPKRVTVVVHRVQCVRWRCDPGLQEALTDRVSSALTRSKRHKLVDRANLNRAMGEQLKCRKGIRKGIISRECLIQAGRVAQAEKMIWGRLIRMGRKGHQLTLGITDLSSVQSERSVSLLCKGCDAFALAALADRAVAKLVGVTVKPVKPGGGSNPPPPAPAPEPDQALPPVAPELGRLRVEGSPRGAQVEVSGPKKFRGPKKALLPKTWSGLPAGTYRVKVTATNREPYETRAQVLPDRTKVVTVSLVHAFGKLTVGGKPKGARVVVTGAGGYRKTWGLTRGYTLNRVRRGTYTVTVSRTGYTAFQQQVTVPGGKEARVAVKLEQVATAAPGGRTVGGKAGLVWVAIPGGAFMMGSNKGDGDEKPVHRVSVKAFQMNRAEVTVAQYGACVKTRRCTRPHWDDGTCFVYKGGKWVKGRLPASFRSGSQPAVCVDWNQARAFCRWAGGRLPSEAEWEYAARSGGKNIQYPWGNQKATCSRAVMLDGSGNGCGKDRTWPVCSKPAGNTAQGLCDMAGNVYEWMEDRWHGSYTGAPKNGRAWTAGTNKRRVLRGGSWNSHVDYVRAANRFNITPAVRDHYLGFRCARTRR